MRGEVKKFFSIIVPGRDNDKTTFLKYFAKSDFASAHLRS